MPVAELLGGAEKMLDMYLAYMDRDRIEASVIFTSPGSFADIVRNRGVASTTIDAGRLRDPLAFGRAVLSLRREFAASKPDIVLDWMGKSHLYSGLALGPTRSRAKNIWWQHSIVSGTPFDRLITRLPARAVGASSAAAALAQEALRPKRPTFVVHPGIEDEFSPSAVEQATEIRRELQLGEGEVLAGMICRLQRWKGQHRFIEAIAALRDRGRSVRGILVGGDAHSMEPDYPDELRRLIAKHGLEEAIHMVDHQSDPRPFLYALDIFVNASENENLSLALIEAMASSRAILAVDDAGGSAEAITHDESGWLIRRAAVPEIIEALDVLISDGDLRTRLSQGARRTYEERFTAERMAARLDAELLALTSS